MIRRLLARIIDTYRNYGEKGWAYPTQRQYRRYLEGIDQATPAEPYVLTTVRVVEGDWITRAKERDRKVRLTVRPCDDFSPISDDSDLCNTCGYKWGEHPAEWPEQEVEQ